MQRDMTTKGGRRYRVTAWENGPKVFVERHVWSKMYGWCRAANTEVSGRFLVKYEDGNFFVRDVYFPKQYCSGGYTEMDDMACLKLNYKLDKAGKTAEYLNRGWWHTHYNFNTFWSGTDDDNAISLAMSINDWYLSIVINQKGDWLCRADFMLPHPITIDQIPIYLIPNSVKRKRKRNFKYDIRKFVRPLSENKNQSKTFKEEGPIQTTTAQYVPERQHIDSEYNQPSWMQSYYNEFWPNGGSAEEPKREWIEPVLDLDFYKCRGCAGVNSHQEDCMPKLKKQTKEPEKKQAEMDWFYGNCKSCENYNDHTTFCLEYLRIERDAKPEAPETKFYGDKFASCCECDTMLQHENVCEKEMEKIEQRRLHGKVQESSVTAGSGEASES